MKDKNRHCKEKNCHCQFANRCVYCSYFEDYGLCSRLYKSGKRDDWTRCRGSNKDTCFICVYKGFCDKTINEQVYRVNRDMEELNKAWDKFIITVCIEFKIYKILDWLNNKLVGKKKC